MWNFRKYFQGYIPFQKHAFLRNVYKDMLSMTSVNFKGIFSRIYPARPWWNMFRDIPIVAYMVYF